MTQRVFRSLLFGAAIALMATVGQPTQVFAQDDDDYEDEDDGGGGGGGGGGARNDDGGGGGGRRSGGSSRNWDINQPHQGGRPFQLDVHAGFTWFGLGLATGARFGIPLMDNGFIESINNAVYLNFGADFYFIRTGRCTSVGMGGGCNGYEYGPGLGFPVTLHWEFYFSEQWSAYAELGFQIFLHPGVFDGRGFLIDGGQWFVFGVGGTFRVNELLSLTLRVGTPYIAFGLQFEFGG